MLTATLTARQGFAGTGNALSSLRVTSACSAFRRRILAEAVQREDTESVEITQRESMREDCVLRNAPKGSLFVERQEFHVTFSSANW